MAIRILLCNRTGSQLSCAVEKRAGKQHESSCLKLLSHMSSPLLKVCSTKFAVLVVFILFISTVQSFRVQLASTGQFLPDLHGKIRNVREAHAVPPLAHADLTRVSIFIGISSFRDDRCGRTLERAFAEARHPERVFVGLVQQNAPTDVDCVEQMCQLMQARSAERGAKTDGDGNTPTCRFRGHVRVTNMSHMRAAGPAHARHFQQRLLTDDHEFCLQVDAHSDFRVGWDLSLLHEWTKCRNEFAILTTYPPRITEKPQGEIWDGHDLATDDYAVPHLCEAQVAAHGMFRNMQASLIYDAQEPILTSKWAAGFSFSKCHAERTVPNDPLLRYVWDGEEVSRAARLWTHGYDFYTPSKKIVYHDYDRPGTVVKAITDEAEKERSMQRIFQLLHMPRGAEPERPTRWGVYGLGPVRELTQYARFSGMNFSAGTAHMDGKCGELALVPWSAWAAAELARRIADDAASSGAQAHDARWQRASMLFDTALLQQPTNASLLVNRGICYRLAGRVTDAISDFWRAIELQPALVEGGLNLLHALNLSGSTNASQRQTACSAVQVGLAAQPQARAWISITDINEFCKSTIFNASMDAVNDVSGGKTEAVAHSQTKPTVPSDNMQHPATLRACTTHMMHLGSQVITQQISLHSAVRLFKICRSMWRAEVPLVHGNARQFHEELRHVLQLGTLMYEIHALPQAEFAFRRAVLLASVMRKSSAEQAFWAPDFAQGIASVAHALLGRLLIERGSSIEAEQELLNGVLLSVRNEVDKSNGMHTSTGTGIGQVIARRALPSLLLARGAVREALAWRYRDQSIRTAAQDKFQYLQRHDAAQREACDQAVNASRADTAQETLYAYIALLPEGTRMQAPVAAFSGKVSKEPTDVVIATGQPLDGCAELQLNQTWINATRDATGGHLKILLLMQRGGCAFTDKARTALSLSERYSADSSSNISISGLVVSNNANEAASVMGGEKHDVLVKADSTLEQSCDIEPGTNYDKMQNIAAVPLATNDQQAIIGECCTLCKSVAACSHWTVFDGVCYLKSGEPKRVNSAGSVSGVVKTPTQGKSSHDKIEGSQTRARNLLPAMMVSGDDGTTLLGRAASPQGLRAKFALAAPNGDKLDYVGPIKHDFDRVGGERHDVLDFMPLSLRTTTGRDPSFSAMSSVAPQEAIISPLCMFHLQMEYAAFRSQNQSQTEAPKLKSDLLPGCRSYSLCALEQSPGRPRILKAAAIDTTGENVSSKRQFILAAPGQLLPTDDLRKICLRGIDGIGAIDLKSLSLLALRVVELEDVLSTSNTSSDALKSRWRCRGVGGTSAARPTMSSIDSAAGGIVIRYGPSDAEQCAGNITRASGDISITVPTIEYRVWCNRSVGHNEDPRLSVKNTRCNDNKTFATSLRVDWPSHLGCAETSPFTCPQSGLRATPLADLVTSAAHGIGLDFLELLRLSVHHQSKRRTQCGVGSKDDDVPKNVESSRHWLANDTLATAIAIDTARETALENSNVAGGGVLWVAEAEIEALSEFNRSMWDRQRVKKCVSVLESASSLVSGWDGGLAGDSGASLVSALRNASIAVPNYGCCPQRALIRAQATTAEEFFALTRNISDVKSDSMLDALFSTYAKMGLFLDELGAPDESLRHFVAALAQCGPNVTGLVPRVALTVPTVADSGKAIMTRFGHLRKTTRKSFADYLLPLLRGNLPQTGSPSKKVPPERAIEYSWTLTPATMFHWYSGMRGLDVSRGIAAMFLKAFPELSGDQHQLPSQNGTPNERTGPLRIGFVSSFLRKHSVGKLMRGIIVGLDSERFNVTVFAASHFFSPDEEAGTGNASHGSDPVASELRAATNFVVLPPNITGAARLINSAALDVLVYPEIGMDAFVYFLAFQRLAPIQLMFWGHPVSPAMPTDSIDYFVTSDLFEPNDRKTYIPCQQSQCLLHENMSRIFPSLASPISTAEKYAEQPIRMRSLTTLFAPPVSPMLQEVWAASNSTTTKESSFVGAARRRLGFAKSDRIYVCPQTLMKFHPAFDVAIASILERDPSGVIVIIFSARQEWWKRRLERRLSAPDGVRPPVDVNRLRFFTRLPHAEFVALIAAADVALDPFPWGGGVSTLDAFAAGTPVVTAPSLQTVVQLAAGMYRQMNFTTASGACCVASGIDEYVDMAVRVANNDSLRFEAARRISQLRSRIYDDRSSLTEWDTLLTRLGKYARAPAPE